MTKQVSTINRKVVKSAFKSTTDSQCYIRGFVFKKSKREGVDGETVSAVGKFFLFAPDEQDEVTVTEADSLYLPNNAAELLNTASTVLVQITKEEGEIKFTVISETSFLDLAKQ